MDKQSKIAIRLYTKGLNGEWILDQMNEVEIESFEQAERRFILLTNKLLVK